MKRIFYTIYHICFFIQVLSAQTFNMEIENDKINSLIKLKQETQFAKYLNSKNDTQLVILPFADSNDTVVSNEFSINNLILDSYSNFAFFHKNGICIAFAKDEGNGFSESVTRSNYIDMLEFVVKYDSNPFAIRFFYSGGFKYRHFIIAYRYNKEMKYIDEHLIVYDDIASAFRGVKKIKKELYNW